MQTHSLIPIKSVLITGSLILFLLSILAGLEIWHGLHQLMVHIFLLFGLFLMVRQVLLLIAAQLRKKQLSGVISRYFSPSVTVIIPAYNEQAVIEASLTSLLNIDYPNYDIIMVDDGSSDETVAIARRIQQEHASRKLQIITQTNSGKSSALNTGLKHATGELVLCVDSDSRIEPDSLLWGVQHFIDPTIAAVAGHVRIANDHNLLTRFQQLEYLISQNFVRLAFSWFGTVTVIPGPVGLFRRHLLAELNGYSEDKNLFAEDADLTVRLLASGWRIVSEDRMIASTEAPEGVYPLLRQRYRWKRGIYQTLHLNFLNLVFSKGKREPFIALLLVLEGVLMEIMSFAITLFVLASFFRFAELRLLYTWFALLFALDLMVLMTAAGRGWWRCVHLLVLQKLTYGYGLQAWGALSLMDEWRSTKMSWDKVERVGGIS